MLLRVAYFSFLLWAYMNRQRLMNNELFEISFHVNKIQDFFFSSL